MKRTYCIFVLIACLILAVPMVWAEEAEEEVIYPYTKTYEEIYSGMDDLGVEGQQLAKLQYLDDHTVLADIYEVVLYGKDDIENLQPEQQIFIHDQIETITRVEWFSDTNVYLYTEDQEIHLAYGYGGYLEGLESKYAVMTQQVALGTDGLAFFQIGEEPFPVEKFSQYIREPEELFADWDTILFVQDGQLMDVLIVESMITSVETTPEQCFFLEVPDALEPVEGAAAPVFFLSMGEFYALMEGEESPVSYEAALRYVSDTQLEADVYRTWFYRTSDLRSLQTGDKLLLAGETLKVAVIEDFLDDDIAIRADYAQNPFHLPGYRFHVLGSGEYAVYLDATKVYLSDEKELSKAYSETVLLEIAEDIQVDDFYNNRLSHTDREEFLQKLKNGYYDEKGTNIIIQDGKLAWVTHNGGNPAGGAEQ